MEVARSLAMITESRRRIDQCGVVKSRREHDEVLRNKGLGPAQPKRNKASKKSKKESIENDRQKKSKLQS